MDYDITILMRGFVYSVTQPMICTFPRELSIIINYVH